MHFIPPAEISGKIMTLIDQAKEELIIVSPYNKVTDWDKLIKRLDRARERGVGITWYIRSGVKNNARQIRSLGIEPIEVDNLHAKLYMNENDAVVTSMNLSEYSDTSSIDIGYFIDEKDEYSNLTRFIGDHLASYNQLKKEKTQLNQSGIEYFNQLVVEHIKKIIKFDSNVRTYKGQYSEVLLIKPFIENTSLKFEPRGAYYRIDLQIYGNYKVKRDLYNYLCGIGKELQEKIGHDIAFGGQMKRLKVDLEIFDHYKYEEWGDKEFKIIHAYIDKIVPVYIESLSKYKGISL